MIIEKARELGLALSESKEFIEMNEAQRAMELDEALMQKINRFNEMQSQIMELMSSKDEAQAEISMLSAEAEALRTELIKNETFVKMLETQVAFQTLMKRVNRVIGVCIGAEIDNDEDAATDCSGNCAGCHNCQ